MQVELEQVRLRLRGGESAAPGAPTTPAYAGLEYCGSEFETEMQAVRVRVSVGFRVRGRGRVIERETEE